jgi:hypothetical protein
MRSLPSDPDIKTIVDRIESGDLDLQPNFQRGEVWSKTKKQRLIDTILREWHVPPIHVIEPSDSRRQEVLDGQQRLAAIRDFARGELQIDGHIEPFDSEISQLHGLKYRNLSPSWRRRFDQYTIRVFRIVDYKAAEPGELFFRLNQPTSLTAAEQRNAYFGPVRQQVKQLVAKAEQQGLGRDFFGFSNARMAYDDILARVALTVEKGSISDKITAAKLADLYRGTDGLSPATTTVVDRAIDVFARAREFTSGRTFTLNKATVYSWFVFVIRAAKSARDSLDPSLFAEFLSAFEDERGLYLLGESQPFVAQTTLSSAGLQLLLVYDSRSTSRVADVSSVLLRDAVIWRFFEAYLQWRKKDPSTWASLMTRVNKSIGAVGGSSFDDDAWSRRLLEDGWGQII